MRDGTRLSTQVYLPSGKSERFPVIMMRTPYSNSIGMGAFMKKCALPPDWVAKTFEPFVTHGYAFVLQDVRGTGASAGTFNPWFQEREDGYDAVEWAAAQPWSNGKVGITGISYMGRTGLQATLAQPPHLVAVVAGYTPADSHGNSQYENGVFYLAGCLFWSHLLGRDGYWRELRQSGLSEEEAHDRATAWFQASEKLVSSQWVNYLPMAEMPELKNKAPFYYEWLSHPSYSSYWAAVDIEAQTDRVTVPVLLMGGWYDEYALSMVHVFEGVRAKGGSEQARRQVKLVLKPICHGPCAKQAVTFGHPDTDMLAAADQLPWWDHWLKGLDTGADRQPPLRLYVMMPPDSGTAGSGFWIQADQYPLPGTQSVDFNVLSQGHANTAAGDGVLDSARSPSGAPDRFTYDPSNPVPTVSDVGWIDGALNQNEVEKRNDVLVYTSAVLTKDIVVIGPVNLTFWAKTSAPDTSFSGKLVDVHPDSYAQNVIERVMHARYRFGSKSPPTPIVPGKAFEYQLYLGDTATVFKKGHRIRLEISSSNFPQFARNLNTGGDLAQERTPRLANQTLLHDAEHPTHLKLPVVPDIETYRKQ
jgi:putative CocE/NonD family hydrolase